MPLFTIKEIDLQRKRSSKIPGLAIVETLDCGKKFKEERYISADSITNRQWGIPNEAQTFKDPIVKSPIRSDSDKKGVSSTLYDPRRCETDIQEISDFKTKPMQKDKTIGFAHAIDLI